MSGIELVGIIAAAVVVIAIVLRDARGRASNEELNRRVFGTLADPRVADMVTRQKAYGRRLRREGRSLLSGKAYKPELTKPTEEPAPIKAARRIYAIKGSKA